MKRINMFLIILIASIAALVASTAVGFAVFTSTTGTQNPSNWMGQMWGGKGTSSGMMGQMQTSAVNPLLPYFGALFAVLIGTTVVGIVGLAYFVAVPQIKIGAASHDALKTSAVSVAPQVSPIESVSKTLTAEERKIIQVLNAHEGKYLQKYIRSEAGLSRLKTHRIIARLAERDIVTLEKTGNTNQVYLAGWLKSASNTN